MTESAQPTVLYIEADELARQSVARRLARNGLTVLSTVSAEEGLRATNDGSCVSVIVVGMDVPAAKGLDSIREVRSRFPTAPIIVCGCSLPENLFSDLSALKVPRDRCLCKPCRFDTLLDAIRAVASTVSRRIIEPVQKFS